MESLYILVPISIIFTLLAVKLFLWSIDSHQYEDLDREAHRILEDD